MCWNKGLALACVTTFWGMEAVGPAARCSPVVALKSGTPLDPPFARGEEEDAAQVVGLRHRDDVRRERPSMVWSRDPAVGSGTPLDPPVARGEEEVATSVRCLAEGALLTDEHAPSATLLPPLRRGGRGGDWTGAAGVEVARWATTFDGFWPEAADFSARVHAC